MEKVNSNNMIGMPNVSSRPLSCDERALLFASEINKKQGLSKFASSYVKFNKTQLQPEIQLSYKIHRLGEHHTS